jgi:hypothetical protein
VEDNKCILSSGYNSHWNNCNRLISSSRSSQVDQLLQQLLCRWKRDEECCQQLIHAAKSLSAIATTQFLHEAAPISWAITLPSNMVSELSSPELGSSSDKQVIRVIPDATGKTHYLVNFDVTKDPSGRS